MGNGNSWTERGGHCVCSWLYFLPHRLPPFPSVPSFPIRPSGEECRGQICSFFRKAALVAARHTSGRVRGWAGSCPRCPPLRHAVRTRFFPFPPSQIFLCSRKYLKRGRICTSRFPHVVLRLAILSVPSPTADGSLGRLCSSEKTLCFWTDFLVLYFTWPLGIPPHVGTCRRSRHSGFDAGHISYCRTSGDSHHFCRGVSRVAHTSMLV